MISRIYACYALVLGLQIPVKDLLKPNVRKETTAAGRIFIFEGEGKEYVRYLLSSWWLRQAVKNPENCYDMVETNDFLQFISKVIVLNG